MDRGAWQATVHGITQLSNWARTRVTHLVEATRQNKIEIGDACPF